jgi:hypothetical protein
MDLDFKTERVACGNTKGRIFVYDIDSGTIEQEIIMRQCNSTIRKVSFNHSAQIIVAVCSDSSLWRVDLS